MSNCENNGDKFNYGICGDGGTDKNCINLGRTYGGGGTINFGVITDPYEQEDEVTDYGYYFYKCTAWHSMNKYYIHIPNYKIYIKPLYIVVEGEAQIDRIYKKKRREKSSF